MKLSLGKGLQSLIPKKEEREIKSVKKITGKIVLPKNRKESVFNVEIDKIVPNSSQPRQEFSKDNLRELADSIREHGILQPLIVAKIEKSTDRGRDVEYELIAGERRWRAAKIVGLSSVPVIIHDSSASEKIELALVENIQREDLNPIDLALAYKQLSEEFKMRHEDIGKRVGKSRTAITNTMRLLSLPLRIQQSMALGEISEGHARAILLAKEDARMGIFHKTIKNKLSVRQVMNLARIAIDETRKKGGGPKNPLFRKMESDLRKIWEHPVSVIQRRGIGILSVEFHDDEELSRLVNHFVRMRKP